MNNAPSRRSHPVATDIGLRLLGLMLAAAGGVAGYALTRMEHAGRAPDGATPELLAAVLFLGPSFGAMLLCLGHHVFDRVAVSERWRTRTRERRIF